MRSFDEVAVLGFGTMGGGIAQVMAASGRRVTVLDTAQTRIDHGFEAVRRFLRGSVERGKLRPHEVEDLVERITGTTSVDDLAGADLVVEAVSEQIEVKRPLLGQVAAVVRAETPLCTNTSALSVTDLAAHLPSPERVAGLHFFNPAPVMATVEVVRALQTSETLIEELADFVEQVGKVPVLVKDRPGFLVNRLLIPYLNDVVAGYDEELASAADIDRAIELGLGHRLGPLALLDMIGLDVHLHASESAYASTLDPQLAPPPLLRQMVAAGWLGDKTGHGFRVGTGEETK